MPSSLIPPTPSAADYADSGDRALIPETADPIALFQQWMADARAHELNDSNAMSLATVDSGGNPDVRIVLLKGVDAAGFTFFTNLESAKGVQLCRERGAIVLQELEDVQADGFCHDGFHAGVSGYAAWGQHLARQIAALEKA